MALPLIAWVLGVPAVGYGIKKLFFDKKARFLGDLAQIGDDVEIPVPNLIVNNRSIDANMFPPGTNSVMVYVQGANAELLQGPIRAIGAVPLPAAIGSVVVNRQDVTKIVRQGKTATDRSAGFHGDAARRPASGRFAG